MIEIAILATTHQYRTSPHFVPRLSSTPVAEAIRPMGIESQGEVSTVRKQCVREAGVARHDGCHEREQHEHGDAEPADRSEDVRGEGELVRAAAQPEPGSGGRRRGGA